jgi:hypothetical protein
LNSAELVESACGVGDTASSGQARVGVAGVADDLEIGTTIEDTDHLASRLVSYRGPRIRDRRP